MKMMKNNNIVKPLAVITASAPSIGYLLSQSHRAFGAQEVVGSEDMVMVSAELIKSFQGALILLILLISIINIYKPPKVIIFALVIGGMSLVASSLLKTIGFTFLTYGIGLGFNALTLNKTIERNEKLREKKMEIEIDNIIKEASR